MKGIYIYIWGLSKIFWCYVKCRLRRECKSINTDEKNSFKHWYRTHTTDQTSFWVKHLVWTRISLSNRFLRIGDLDQMTPLYVKVIKFLKLTFITSFAISWLACSQSNNSLRYFQFIRKCLHRIDSFINALIWWHKLFIYFWWNC